jgi:DNA-binding XRE family transcriptional regulator
MKKLTGEEREALLIQLLLEVMRGERTEGSLLRTLRKEVTGMNQDQYAALVNISRRTLSDIERDAGNQTITVVNRAFKPFGLKVGLLPRNQMLLERLLKQQNDVEHS